MIKRSNSKIKKSDFKEMGIIVTHKRNIPNALLKRDGDMGE